MFPGMVQQAAAKREPRVSCFDLRPVNSQSVHLAQLFLTALLVQKVDCGVAIEVFLEKVKVYRFRWARELIRDHSLVKYRIEAAEASPRKAFDLERRFAMDIH